ncbi:MAG: UDP-N-acetylmuramoyl-tripeptide--D-alanyl-D-alanine ligase, partial [Anaeroplasmataceae bacterium]|nr:UDP-N-acetylmuramoyl-tripeptide--D-alanyl-D-alanine ligase [Anaeroplasmataceae bacterium]
YLHNQKFIKKASKKMAGYRGQVIAITGSFGKTSTKLLFNQALGLFYSCLATEKSYNTELGISIFINKIPDLNVYDYLIFEFGASHPKDIAKLKKIAPPDIVVVTEIGLMHVETFGNLDNIIREKMSIIDGAKLAILNYDCNYIRSYPVPKEVKVLSYGFEYGNYRGELEDQTLSLYYNEVLLGDFKHQLVGTHQSLNLLGVLALCHHLGCDLEKLRRGVYGFHGVKNRLEVKKIKNRTILDDSFNSNYKGFIEALNVLKQSEGKRILLTPGMVELGKYKKEMFHNLVSYIVASTDIIILIGYFQTRSLYEDLKTYSKEVYIVRNFMEGYALYMMLVQMEDESMLLIENDVPDLYKVGLL